MAASKEIIETAMVFNNSSLFSNHYLENMIQKTPEWNDDVRLIETYTRIKEILDRKGKNFERYVEGEVGAKVEDLTPKTKVQEYHKQQFDELAILKKNKRKIATDPARSRSRPQEERNLRRHKIEAEMEAVNGCENQPPAATSITGLIRQTNRHFAYLKLIST